MEQEKEKPVKLETCSNTIEVGVKKCTLYSTRQLIILGLLGGAFTALGGFAASMGAHAIDNYSMSKFINGSLFSIGLILVLTCGGELFTGNVLTIQAYLQKRITIYQFFRNLFMVYVFNFLGVFIVSSLIYFSQLLTSNNGKVLTYILETTAYKSDLTFTSSLASGILCNFLICLAVWGAYGTKSMITRIVLGYLAITGFIVSGFENSIANMFYFSTSLLAKLDSSLLSSSGLSEIIINKITLSSAASNIILATIGNAIGGIIFVGIAYWTAYEYVPKKSSKPKAVVVTTTKSYDYKEREISFNGEESFIIDIDKNTRVYIPDTRKENFIDLRYVDFESNYYCH